MFGLPVGKKMMPKLKQHKKIIWLLGVKVSDTFLIFEIPLSVVGAMGCSVVGNPFQSEKGWCKNPLVASLKNLSQLPPTKAGSGCPPETMKRIAGGLTPPPALLSPPLDLPKKTKYM